MSRVTEAGMDEVALRARVREFARDYNEHWLAERHSHRTPTEARTPRRARSGGRGMIAFSADESFAQ